MKKDLRVYLQALEKRIDEARAEHTEIRATIIRLERDSVSRRTYEENRDEMLRQVRQIELNFLESAVFDAFVDSYRREQERNVEDRKNVVDALGAATEQVRARLIDERGDYVTQEIYDQRHDAVLDRVSAVERWEYKLVGGLVFATFIAPIVSGLIVYYVTHG